MQSYHLVWCHLLNAIQVTMHNHQLITHFESLLLTPVSLPADWNFNQQAQWRQIHGPTGECPMKTKLKIMLLFSGLVCFIIYWNPSHFEPLLAHIHKYSLSVSLWNFSKIVLFNNCVIIHWSHGWQPQVTSLFIYIFS